MGYNTRAGTAGLWEGQGFCTVAYIQESITLRELRAVSLLLARSFARLVSSPKNKHLLIREDNQAVVAVLNAMVSASNPMMAELRRLQKLLVAIGIYLETR